MEVELTSEPIPLPTHIGTSNVDTVTSGQPITELQRISLFSDQEWEVFILEWVDSLRTEFAAVERCGGAGDFGRDVIAGIDSDFKDWENFQCKHYANPLMSNDIWIELGKLVFYTMIGKYTYPRRYHFVAPKGAGNKLSMLMRNPEELKSSLFANWDRYCENQITKAQSVSMGDDLRSYINSLDFSIFEATPPLRILDAHAKTRWHWKTFGQLPNRPQIPLPPDQPSENEITYIQQLLNAYGNHLGRRISKVEDIAMESMLEHLDDSRREFYCAESLRLFSRDTLPPGEFEVLQEQIFSGVRDAIRDEYESAYRRVLMVTKTARALQITSHALTSRLIIQDRGGICHQLVNDGKVKWVS